MTVISIYLILSHSRKSKNEIFSQNEMKILIARNLVRLLMSHKVDFKKKVLPEVKKGILYIYLNIYSYYNIYILINVNNKMANS